MRILMIGLCFTASLTVAASADAPRGEGKPHRSEVARGERGDARRDTRPRRQTGENEMDRIRAESCDPAGRFDGYPAWARAAFTCGSQR